MLLLMWFFMLLFKLVFKDKVVVLVYVLLIGVKFIGVCFCGWLLSRWFIMLRSDCSFGCGEIVEYKSGLLVYDVDIICVVSLD